jgi:hypothetical protein
MRGRGQNNSALGIRGGITQPPQPQVFSCNLSYKSDVEMKPTPMKSPISSIHRQTFRSPRVSPLNRHLPPEFPKKRHEKFQRRAQLLDSHLQETIEEDMDQEAEKEPRFARKSRFSEMRDYNEFNSNRGGNGKRYKSEEGRNN